MCFRMLLALGFAFISLSGCLKTRGEIVETSDRRVQQEIRPEAQQAADKEVRLQEAEANIRQLNGRIEALEQHLNSELVERQKEAELRAAAQAQLAEQLRLHEERFARLEAESAARAQVPAPSSSAPVRVNGEKSLETSDAYKEAEALFEKKEWTKAILAYQKYREQNPKGRNFPDATYKIGVSFQELGKKDEAKAFYEEVVKEFPKSNAARKSQFRLRSLK